MGIEAGNTDWIRELMQENSRLKRINQNLKSNLQKLRTRSEYLEGLMANIPQSFWCMDQNGTLLFVNNTFFEEICKHLKRRADEFIGQNFYELAYELGMSRQEILVLEKQNQEFMKNIGPSIQEQKVTLLGQSSVFLTFKKNLHDHFGQHAGLVMLSIDITPFKQQEALLKTALRMIEKTHSEKLHFLQNIRHDLHTPLSNIVAAADLTKNFLADHQSHEFLESIVASGHHVMELFAQLIDFFQTKHQKQPNHMVAIDIRHMIAEITQGMRPQSSGKIIEFKVIIEDHVPSFITTDKIKMTRIINNLIINAFKYTHAGEIVVHISFDEEAELLWIEVRDTGIGMEQGSLEKIFEPMVRLHQEEAGDYKGLGLGLSIVDQFIRDLSGRIQVTSTQGQGSSFKLCLPTTASSALTEEFTALESFE